MNIPSVNLPADLPINWTNGQIVSPSGTDVGLSQQHGYNYLNGAVNDAQAAIKAIRDFFAGSAMVGTSDLINNAVTTAKLADKAVSTVKLGDKSVTTEKLADKAVTWSKLSDESRPIHQNILDNPNFADPINQRGKTIYTISSGNTAYCVDRWIFGYGITVEPVSEGLQLTSKGSRFSFIGQKLPSGLLSGLRGKMCTVSALVKASGGQVNLGRVNNSATLDVGTDHFALATTSFVWPYAADSWSDVINIGFPNGAAIGSTITVAAIKLELGTEQTLTHQDAGGNWILNDPPPNKALELAKCQMYFRRVRAAFLSVHDAGISSGNSNVLISVPTPVPMRATPTVTVTGNFEPHWMSVGSITPKNGTVINCGNMVIFNAIASGIETSNSTDHITTVIIPDDEESYIDLSNDL